MVTSLLADHKLPLDPQVTSIWKAFPSDPQLSTVITLYLIDLLSDCTLHNPVLEENGTADSRFQKAKTGRGPMKARHTGLAAIQALAIMFTRKEMLQVAVGFSDIFVPLLLAMSRYAGVTRYEKIHSDTPGGGYSGGSGGLKKKSASGSSDAKKEKLLPYEVACNAMQSFLTCKGCTSGLATNSIFFCFLFVKTH